MFAMPAEAGETDFIALFDYWRRQTPSGRLPGRQHLDPIDMPRHLLPRVMLFDVERAFDRVLFRVRLTGTKIVELLGCEPRGVLLHQRGLAEAGSLAATLDAATALAAPVVYSAPFVPARGRRLWARRLGLPLARDGRTVDMVLGIYALRDAALAGPSGLVVFQRRDAMPPRLSAVG